MSKSAKAGDVLSAKAGAKLRKSDPHGHFFPVLALFDKAIAEAE